MKSIAAQQSLDSVLRLLEKRGQQEQVKELRELWSTWETNETELLFDYLRERYIVPVSGCDGGDLEVFAAYNNMSVEEFKRNLMSWCS
jgi:hypothetical protein